MAAEGDFLTRYRAVSNKLKKRFLRKPNVAEASEQFGQLAKELKQQDCLQYAAFCNLAMARLVLVQLNSRYLKRGRNGGQLNCWRYPIKIGSKYILVLEMNRPGEAVVHFQRAAELQTQTPIESLLSLWEMASCKILTRDYDCALAVLSEMQSMCQERGLQLPGANTPVGAFMDIVAKCEISRVLLLMLLEPPPQKLLPEHAQTLERYAWESFDSHSQGNSEKDTESLKALQTELWPILTAEQNHLLHLVVQERITPSGQGV
uniref:Coagulation factor VIII associated n=1 Tax=Astyanax mexicanus TaxID=7994 RepID=A0A3B1IXY3_ASTMX